MDRTMPTEDSVPTKWEAKFSLTFDKASPDHVWALFTDFFNVHKLYTVIDSSSAVSGVNGQPGCVRHCSTASFGMDGNDGHTVWSNERLVTVDEDQRCLSYEVLENNIGFESYVSTVRIVPMGDDGCEVKWGISLDPVEGWTLDDFLSKVYEPAVQGLAQRIEESVSVAS